MEIVQLLVQNLTISVLCFTVLWLISIRIKDPSFVDAWWAFGIVVLAWSSFFFVSQVGLHAQLITTLTTIWGLRLGIYLFWRWRTSGPDRRYVTMMAAAKTERGWGFATASLLLVFALQLPLQFIVSLPAQLGQIAAPRTLGALAWIGAAAAMAGILFESIGDFQLILFKADPANEGKVLQSGLWRYTRHPNYFGDACVWWGLYLVALDTIDPLSLPTWVAALALPGPVLLTVLLTRWSGVPTTEGRMRKHKPDYEAYLARTSSFIPRPPKPDGAAGR